MKTSKMPSNCLLAFKIFSKGRNTSQPTLTSLTIEFRGTYQTYICCFVFCFGGSHNYLFLTFLILTNAMSWWTAWWKPWWTSWWTSWRTYKDILNIHAYIYIKKHVSENPSLRTDVLSAKIQTVISRTRTLKNLNNRILDNSNSEQVSGWRKRRRRPKRKRRRRMRRRWGRKRRRRPQRRMMR